mmetsp:Transcript_48618/g.126132  ORF Transcript_48618/g.126132 Transcript_48618/m.126132 type:complete len:200 (+) Transcript_48618:415-1014(+)
MQNKSYATLKLTLSMRRKSWAFEEEPPNRNSWSCSAAPHDPFAARVYLKGTSSDSSVRVSYTTGLLPPSPPKETKTPPLLRFERGVAHLDTPCFRCTSTTHLSNMSLSSFVRSLTASNASTLVVEGKVSHGIASQSFIKSRLSSSGLSPPVGVRDRDFVSLSSSVSPSTLSSSISLPSSFERCIDTYWHEKSSSCSTLT